MKRDRGAVTAPVPPKPYGGTDMEPIETGCRHATSQRIEPPGADGWMRESCGTCGQLLRWTRSPEDAPAGHDNTGTA